MTWDFERFIVSVTGAAWSSFVLFPHIAVDYDGNGYESGVNYIGK